MALPWRWQRFNVTNPTINLLKISSLAFSSFSSASIFAVALIASGCIGNHNGMWSWRLRWRANGNWDKLFSGFWIWSAIMRWMAAGVALKLIEHINRADGLTLKSSIWLSLDNSCRQRRGKNKKKETIKEIIPNHVQQAMLLICRNCYLNFPLSLQASSCYESNLFHFFLLQFFSVLLTLCFGFAFRLSYEFPLRDSSAVCLVGIGHPTVVYSFLMLYVV